MVERTVPGTNFPLDRATYLDSIEFFQKCHWRNTANYASCTSKGAFLLRRSASNSVFQNRQFSISSSAMGFAKAVTKGSWLIQDFRLAYAPYGFSKKNGRLIPNKSELKICRMVVQLRNNSKLYFHEIARELVRRRTKNRENWIS